MSTTIIVTNLKRFGAGVSDGHRLDIAKNFKLLKSGLGTKYKALKIEYANEKYDSFSEAYYSYVLDSMLDKGELLSIQSQVPFRMENYYGRNTLRYVADFIVIGNSGKEYVIDVKGRMTPENKVKYSYFTYVHDKEITIVATSGPGKFDTSFII